MTDESSPRFALYERVKVVTNDIEKAELNGKVGTVWWPGSQDRKGNWLYTVFVCSNGGEWPCEGEMWDVCEDELQPTGMFGWQHWMAIKHPARFDFYEKVLVSTTHPKKRKFNEKTAVVLGRGQNDDGQWAYDVLIYGRETVNCFWENELFPAGGFDREMEEADKHRPHIKVRVDEYGRGHIVDKKDS